MNISYHIIRPATAVSLLVVSVLFSDAREVPLKVKPIHSGGETGHA